MTCATTAPASRPDMDYGSRMFARSTTLPVYGRRLLNRHPLLLDSVLAIATGAVGLALGSQDADGMRPVDARATWLTVLITALLVARRRAPMAILVVYCAVWLVYIELGYPAVVNSPGLLLALYAVAELRRVRVAAAAGVLATAVWVYAGRNTPVLAALQGTVWTAVVIGFGYGAQQLAIRNRQLTGLAMRLEYEQEQRARRAIVDERVRVARELHDVVAHHMSVIAVHAGLALYVLESDPPTARTALDTVLDTNSEALDELRRLLSILRLRPDEPETPPEDARTYAPAPGLDQLDQLTERMGAAGVPVDVVVTGRPRRLAPGTDLCAYRVIQESLTNILKHAAPARATITLNHGAEGLTVRIADDGRPTPTSGGVPGGHGLLGMRERAELYGGTLTAGPRPEGGFEVTLTLPTGSTETRPSH